ncbi:MAG: NAD synthetase [Nitrospira bacterium SG8_35_4]|nr:MAG: NAD synthetase [Nitrospira bacterium SG8_35_4]
MEKIRIALAQINPVVGDLQGNAKKIVSGIKKAGKMKADIIAFPELAVTGYPPEDLLLKPQFIQDNRDILQRVAAATEDITAVIGFVDRNDGIYNAAALVSNKKIIDVYHKKHLPNYGVFDEQRYFRAGNVFPVYSVAGVNIGVNICEDIWHKKSPAVAQAMNGAHIIININASPYHTGKAFEREKMVSSLALRCRVNIAYVNMVGGQDELVFDGGSFVAGPDGEIIVRGRLFREELITVDLAVKKGRKMPGAQDRSKMEAMTGYGRVKKIKITSAALKTERPAIKKKIPQQIHGPEEVYQALLLGTGDYVRKNGFKGVVIGMSGGVDSALVTTIAADALGRENVNGVFMPSQYTSAESREDAFSHAKNLGIAITEISIDTIFNAYLKTMEPFFKGKKRDITEENIQARIRGNILMAFSNKHGWLVLTTGNKSEMSVGYATLYGDMAGGFAVIKDVPKTMVYKLCEWRNSRAGMDLIPARILWKEPTAELKPDQRDTDSLPPYPVLDPILKAYVEEDRNFNEITGMGCDIQCTRRVLSMIDHSEYKRRQAPPGIKITERAFGKDRRFPITNRYKNY